MVGRKNNKFSNPSGITLKDTAYELKTGESVTIADVTVTLVDPGKAKKTELKK